MLELIVKTNYTRDMDTELNITDPSIIKQYNYDLAIRKILFLLTKTCKLVSKDFDKKVIATNDFYYVSNMETHTLDIMMKAYNVHQKISHTDVKFMVSYLLDIFTSSKIKVNDEEIHCKYINFHDEHVFYFHYVDQPTFINITIDSTNSSKIYAFISITEDNDHNTFHCPTSIMQEISDFIEEPMHKSGYDTNTHCFFEDFVEDSPIDEKWITWRKLFEKSNLV